MTRLTGRAVPRNAQPLPRNANKSSNDGGPRLDPARKPVAQFFLYKPFGTALMRGEIDLLSDACFFVAVETLDGSYSRSPSDATLADIPAAAIRGQSAPLENKTIVDGELRSAPFRIKGVAKGATFDSLVMVVDSPARPDQLVSFLVWDVVIGDGGDYPINSSGEDVLLKIGTEE